MSPSIDEFGSSSLEDMFEDTLSDLPPDLGDGFPCEKVKVEHTHTNTHLVAMFTRYACACGLSRDISQGYAIRRVHHTRNQTIQFQAIHSSEITLYANLPGLCKYITHPVPFCIGCLDRARFTETEE